MTTNPRPDLHDGLLFHMPRVMVRDWLRSYFQSVASHVATYDCHTAQMLFLDNVDFLVKLAAQKGAILLGDGTAELMELLVTLPWPRACAA